MVKANAKVKSNAKPLEFLKRLTKRDEYERIGCRQPTSAKCEGKAPAIICSVVRPLEGTEVNPTAA